jgi:hypothetical protein
VNIQRSPGAQTIEAPAPGSVEAPSTGDGDHERFSHYVPKESLTAALVEGTPVVALCGKVWVPSRDPQRFPVCPECRERWAALSEGDTGNGE